MERKFLKKTVLVGMCFLLSFVLIIGVVQLKEVKAASFEDINSSMMFFKQNTTSTCTLASAAMLVRRAALLNGNGSWASITESSLQSTAWLSGAGLLNSFSYAGINVSSAKISSNRTQTMINLLASHPEGIVIYDFKKPHAILLTDYTNGTFYCADPSSAAPAGRIPISQATITVESIDKYWYVSSPSLSLTLSDNNPMGILDCVEGKVNVVLVRGWAFDSDDILQSIDIHIYIGGPAGVGECHAFKADLYRPDVNDVYGVGGNHGFAAEISTSLSGNQEVYVYAINIGSGSNQLIGMQTVNIVKANNPTWTLDCIEGRMNAVYVRGWAFDLDDISRTLEIHVYIGDSAGLGEGHKIVADLYRPDVNDVYGAGDNHGFVAEIPTTLLGNQKIYIYIINIESGENVLVEPKTVFITCNHFYENYISNQNGTHSTICNNCGKTEVADCHYEISVVNPTCNSRGYTTYTCIDCAYTYQENYVDCVEHSFTNYISDNNATSESDGTKTAYCDNGCGMTNTILDEGSASKKAMSDLEKSKNNTINISIEKVKSFKAKSGKKKLTLSWKKLSGITGYQIQVSTKKNLKKARTIMISGLKKKYVKKGLKSQKRYYIRIRGYKDYRDTNGKIQKVYGKWNKIKKKTK